MDQLQHAPTLLGNWTSGGRLHHFASLVECKQRWQTIIHRAGLKAKHGQKRITSKIRQSREMSFVNGNCYWYGYLILDNADEVTSLLKTEIHRAKALLPAYTPMTENPKK